MEIVKMVLEYLRALLSAPVMAAAVCVLFLVLFREDLKALLLRVAKIRFPGGTEVSTPQSDRQAKEADIEKKPPPELKGVMPGLPSGLTSEQQNAVEQIIRAERGRSYLWEYRYLNYFLVHHTQRVLDWFASLAQPVTYGFYDTYWIPHIPRANERSAIINVLQAHHLVTVNNVIKLTPKGRDYLDWRGPLPELPVTSESRRPR